MKRAQPVLSAVGSMNLTRGANSPSGSWKCLERELCAICVYVEKNDEKLLKNYKNACSSSLPEHISFKGATKVTVIGAYFLVSRSVCPGYK